MKFYVLTSPLFDDKDYAFAEPKDDQYGDFPECETCGKPIGQREWLRPRTVRLSRKRVGDVVFGSIFPFLISTRACKVFDDEKIKGLGPVERVYPTNSNVELFLPRIARGALLVDEASSGFKRDEVGVCPVCHIGGTITYFEKLVPIGDSWNDLELFILPQLPGTIVSEERFVKVVKDYQLANFRFTPIAEYRCPWKPY